MKTNRNFGKLVNGSMTYAPAILVTDAAVITLPTAEDYLANGYKAVVDVYPTDAAGNGKHWEANGWTETEAEITRQWIAADDVKLPRVFSKLKCYGALVTLGKWAEVKAWLEAQNLWDAFLLAQDVREDNDYFVAGLAQFKAQFGMDDAAVEAILSQCVAEGN